MTRDQLRGGSHRAPRQDAARDGERVRVRVVALLVVLVVAVWAGFLGLHRSGSDTAADRPAADRSTTGATTPTTGPVTTPSPTTTPTVTPSAPPPEAPLADLPAAPPQHLTSADAQVDAGFNQSATLRDVVAAVAGHVNVVRVSDRGTPASPGTDAVVVVGDATPGSGGAFERLDQAQPGSLVSISTLEGVLTYSVTSTQQVSSNGVLSTPQVSARGPGRLVLVGARFTDAGTPAATDVVVVAELTAVQRG